MRHGARLWIAAVALVIAAAAAWAEAAPEDPVAGLSEQLAQEPFELAAESLHYDLDRELYIARGDVAIHQSGRTLRADWVAFNRRTGAGVASGNVRVEDSGDVVTADFVEFELETMRGVVHGGRLESETSRFRASAAQIAKTGANTYSFRDGRFTTCRCPDPDDVDPWVLRSERAELEVEGYAVARNTTFDVWGVPLAWIPWMIIPVKTERQTGLLFPEFSLGSLRGFEVGLPFFWAIRDEAGLVVTPRYSVKRGPGGASQFDYVFGERSEGLLEGAYYHDQEIDPKTPETPFGRHRWSTAGVHDWYLPGSLRFQSDYRFASDNDVPFDFKELDQHRADRFLESQASLTRAFGSLGRAGARVRGTFVDDLQNPDDLDRDRFLLQRWPDAHLHSLPGDFANIPFLVPSLDIEYARFEARQRAEQRLPTAIVGERGLFLDTGLDALPNPLVEGQSRSELGPLPDPYGDDFVRTGGTEGDGFFQEGEPLTDRGHRLLVQPRLALPIDFRGISIVPEVGWHQTLYDSRVREFRQRAFPTARVDVSTRLRRRFEGFVHVIEPRAGYAMAYTRSQERNALFVPATAAPLERVRALDLDSVTRDDADRIARANRVTAGFDNRLYDRRTDGAMSLLADVTLLGQYDAEGEDFDALILDGHAYPHDRLDMAFHADFDPSAGRLDEALAEGRWNLPSGVALSGGYRWARRIPLFFEDFQAGDRFDSSSTVEHINQVRAGVALDLTQRWSLGYALAYSVEGNQVLANRGLIEYISRCECWALGVEIAQDRERGVDAKLVYRLIGLSGGPARPRPSLLDGL